MDRPYIAGGFNGQNGWEYSGGEEACGIDGWLEGVMEEW